MVMPLGVALAVTSAATQTRWSVRLREGWNEPTSVYVLIPADPGELKTPTCRPILAPLISYEREERERADAENKSKAIEREVLADRVKQLRREAAKSIEPGDRADLVRQIDALESEVPTVTRPRRILADDTTPERLSRLMAENHGAMSVITDEGGAFLNRLSGYYSNGVPNIDAVLKAYDGGPLRIDRCNGNDVHLDAARLAVCLMAQKSVTRKALSNPEFMSRGLIHRFLFLLPGSSRVGYRSFEHPPTPGRVERAWDELIRRLMTWSPAEVTCFGTATHTIKLSKPAEEQFWRYHATLEEQVRGYDQEDPRRIYRLKWAGTVGRLAGLMHCLAVCAEGDKHTPHSRRIDEETMTHAIGLSSLLLDHADAAMGMLGLDLRVERARRILTRVEDHDGEISHNELWQKLRNARSLFSSHQQFSDAVELLIKRGYLAWRCEGKSDFYILSEPALEASPRANRALRARVL